VTQIKHLALCNSVSLTGLWLPNAMEYMLSLETLSIVYPRSSGNIDWFEEITLPSDPNATLRLLTEKEMAQVIVTANYIESTWAEDLEITWRDTAREHLERIERGLIHPFVNGYTSPVAPAWNMETKKLNLIYQARIFQS
jgi:hypothetical protein